MVNATLVAAVVQIFVILLFGRAAQSRGPGRVTVTGDITTALAAWPLFELIDTGQARAITLAASTGIGLQTIAYTVTASQLSELFPADYRYYDTSLGYSPASTISGCLPLLTAWLIGMQTMHDVHAGHGHAYRSGRFHGRASARAGSDGGQGGPSLTSNRRRRRTPGGCGAIVRIAASD